LKGLSDKEVSFLFPLNTQEGSQEMSSRRRLIWKVCPILQSLTLTWKKLNAKLHPSLYMTSKLNSFTNVQWDGECKHCESSFEPAMSQADLGSLMDPLQGVCMDSFWPTHM
jgi:hypothetical protein